MRKKWIIEDFTPLDQGNPDLLIQTILNKRGIRGKEAIRQFLKGQLLELHDPYLLTGMKTAVERIIQAQQVGERVIIYGDYDVDGITATTLLYLYCQEELGIEMGYYLPDRLTEGYGLNLAAIKAIVQADYHLLITVDCGITAAREVAYARENKLDVIITDHHQPGSELPEALAIINPHCDHNYPFKGLAGVGVAFKLCQGLEKSINGNVISPFLEERLDIVTLGTIADLVPLVGENRIMVKQGLELINNSKQPAIQALLQQTGLKDRAINAGQISFILAPPLNAAGRLKRPDTAIELLTTTNQSRAEELAAQLVRANQERQQLEELIYQDAVKMMDELELEQLKVIVLASEKWHQGIIGIVASRLVERYYRPVILIALREGRGKGSCRSIKNLNIYQALKQCAQHLIGFGGHACAAGLEIEEKKIEQFKAELNQILSGVLTAEDLIPSLELDAVLPVEQINEEVLTILEGLEPFGIGNPRPRFMLNDIVIEQGYPVGKGKQHLKFKLSEGINGIGFGFGQEQLKLVQKRVDLAFNLEFNEWKGQREIQLKLEDYNLREDLNFYPVYFKKDGIVVADKRNCNDRLEFLKSLLNLPGKIGVYCHNLSLIASYLLKLAGSPVFNGNTNQGQNDFQEKGEGIIFFSRREVLSEQNIDRLVFFSLPFSLQDFQEIVTLLPEKCPLYLLFGQADIKQNQALITSRIADDRYLRRFYRFLQSRSDHPVKVEQIGEELKTQNMLANKYIINNAISILQELNLVEQNSERMTLLPISGKKLDLSQSISYNKNIRVVNDFWQCVELVNTGDLFNLIDKIKVI